MKTYASSIIIAYDSCSEGSILFPAKQAHLNELLESTVHRRTRFDSFVKVNSSQRALANAFGGELEFL